MRTIAQRTRPSTFQAGAEYLRAERSVYRGEPARPVQVRFCAYDPCPAFVIVLAPDGRRQRCPREELFTPEGILQSEAVW